MQTLDVKSFRAATALVLVAALAAATPLAFAANNTGTGDIAGVDADLADSSAFALSTTTLGLIKRAFLAADGSPLASGASLPRGTQVKFMIYINNDTAVPVADISVQDALAATFAYQAGTIKVDNTLVSSVVCPGGVCAEAAIFAAVEATSALSDAVGVGDVASYVAPTIGVGNQVQGNAQLDLAAGRVWAVVFTVTMQ